MASSVRSLLRASFSVGLALARRGAGELAGAPDRKLRFSSFQTVGCNFVLELKVLCPETMTDISAAAENPFHLGQSKKSSGGCEYHRKSKSFFLLTLTFTRGF